MSTIIIALILLAIVLSSIFLLVRIDALQKQKEKQELLSCFSKLGINYQLTFSCQEVLRKGVFGLDSIQRKLLVLNKQGADGGTSQIIDLNEVKSCTVKKKYAGVSADTSGSRREDTYLQSIVLQFEMPDAKPVQEIFFYRHEDNHVYEIYELEQKAKHWEILLAKLKAPTGLLAL